MRRSSSFVAGLFALAAVTALAQGAAETAARERPIPRLVTKDGRSALFVDNVPYFVLGAQVNNSSGWPGVLPKVWPAMEFMHANTAEIPVYWEQFEPRPGQYDYSVVDTLLTQARAHHLHLVLLWFATWKNGSQHYMPEWMKLAPESYAHLVDKDGHPVDSPSPFAAASLEGDTKAFAALMRHLKTADTQRTVLMIQVENEPGTWGTLRDYSPAAQKLFDGPVPAEVLKAMNVPSGAPSLTWQEAFGPEAEVDFHAWAVARYIGQVAAAGKAAYPLPLYANAALRDPIRPGGPGSYESGGPTDNVIPIWKAAAPALDMVSPDNYNNNPTVYNKVLELYHRDDNPLYIPETGGSPRLFFFALAHQAIGFSPFGIDGNRPIDPDLAATYRLLAQLWPMIFAHQGSDSITAVRLSQGEEPRSVKLGDYTLTLTYTGRSAHIAPQPKGGVVASPPPPSATQPAPEPPLQAAAVLIANGPDEFYFGGGGMRIDFTANTPGPANVGLGDVQEGKFVDGKWVVLRQLAGDDTAQGEILTLRPNTVLRVTVYRYP